MSEAKALRDIFDVLEEHCVKPFGFVRDQVWCSRFPEEMTPGNDGADAPIPPGLVICLSDGSSLDGEIEAISVCDGDVAALVRAPETGVLSFVNYNAAHVASISWQDGPAAEGEAAFES